jgi:hypothetical protein
LRVPNHLKYLHVMYAHEYDSGRRAIQHTSLTWPPTVPSQVQVS